MARNVLMFKVYRLASKGLGHEDICRDLKITDPKDRDSIRRFVLKLEKDNGKGK
jgi:hypothetical protein